MKYNPYSSSKISSFDRCPRQFKYKYIDKVKIPKVDSLPFVKGLIVHKLLEHHEDSLSEKISSLKLNKEISSSSHFNKSLIKECLEIYNNFISSNLGKRILGYKKLVSELPCGLDMKMKSTGYKDGELFRGYIDYVCVDENTNIVYIVDWKTGKDASSGPYSQSPDQLIYYASWYFENFPIDKVIINYVFVEHKEAILSYELNRENLNKYKKMLLVNIKYIETCEDFVKNEGRLCEWCNYFEICNSEI